MLKCEVFLTNDLKSLQVMMWLAIIRVHRPRSVLQISHRATDVCLYINDGINDHGINYDVIV